MKRTILPSVFLAAMAAFSPLAGEPIELGSPIEVTPGIRGAVELTFASTVGTYYQIEISPDATSWDNEGYSMKGTGGQMTAKVSTRNWPQAFYRLRDTGDPANLAPGIAALVPTGTIVAFAGNAAPEGWALCDGSPVDRTTFAELFAVIGISCGEGDGSTTFNLPDLRGRFLRGVDGGAGNDPDSASRTAMNPGGNTGDATGSVQGDAYRSHAHQIITNTSTGGANGVVRGNGTVNGNTTTSPTGSSETRPKNAAVHFIIKL